MLEDEADARAHGPRGPAAQLRVTRASVSSGLAHTESRQPAVLTMTTLLVAAL